MKIEKVTQKTGLLPIRLGTAQITNSHWNIVAVYELKPLFEETNKIESNYNFWMQALENSEHNEHYTKEMSNYITIINKQRKKNDQT